MQRLFPKILLFSSLIIGSNLFGADLSGVYLGRGDGNVQSTLTMKVKGEAISGTLKNQMGEFAIENGNVSGTDVFFNIFIDRDGDRFKMTYRGHAFGDEIQFKIEAGERMLDLIVKKKDDANNQKKEEKAS